MTAPSLPSAHPTCPKPSPGPRGPSGVSGWVGDSPAALLAQPQAGGAGGQQELFPKLPLSHRIAIPGQSFSKVQIRGEAVPTRGKGERGGGFWGQSAVASGGSRSHLSHPCPVQRDQGFFFFSLNLGEPGLLGAPRVGGRGCHGHIPKAEHVPKADDVPKTDHVIVSSMTTTSLRPTVFFSDNCVPKDNAVPKLNHIPKPLMSPWSTTSPRPEMSPAVPTAQLCLWDSSDPTACHIRCPWAGCVPRAAVPRGSGVSSPILSFGLLLLSVAGRAKPGAGHHCLVVPMSPREQPGHQIRVTSSRQEEHRGQNCGDPRWRGGNPPFVSPPLHPHPPTGCPRGTHSHMGPPFPSPTSWNRWLWVTVELSPAAPGENCPVPTPVLVPRLVRSPGRLSRWLTVPLPPPPGAQGAQAGAQGEAVAAPQEPRAGHGAREGPGASPSRATLASRMSPPPCPGFGDIPLGLPGVWGLLLPHPGSPGTKVCPISIPVHRQTALVPRASPCIHPLVWESSLGLPSAP